MKKIKSPTKGSSRKTEYFPYLYSDKETEVAVYYGFAPINPPTIDKSDREKAKELADETNTIDLHPFTNLEEKIALLRNYEEKNMASGPQPVMVYYRGDVHEKKRNTSDCHFNLDILGTTKSIAEATIIQTTLEMLREEGFEDLYVDVNSMGDKDSMARFVRELTSYYKKHIDELSANCKQLLKRNVFFMLECEEEKCQALLSDAPKSIAYLSEMGRLHFKEVLEYLETLDIPYRINHCLIGNRNLVNHTIFQIRSLSAEGKNTPPLAMGFRYNGIAKKAGFRKDVPAVGATLSFKRTETCVPVFKMKKPKVFFAQIGFGAKLKSLKIIEMLRRNKIPLYQALSKDKMASQIQVAENMKIPYILIMGQKESMEDTVIVRNMINRSQDTVRIADLPEHLKKIR